MNKTADRVLCVDDEPEVLQGLSLVLRNDFQVKTCESGEAALVELKEHGPFHAIVSDMQMPSMNGAEFLRRARAVAPDTARILLTGQASVSSAIAAVNEGHIFRFLTKPCPPQELLASLKEAIQQYRERADERIRLEARLTEMSEQVMRADRLATLGSFAAAIGHELGNAVSICLGTIHLIEERHRQGQPPKPELFQALSRAGEHLKAHAIQMRNWAKPRATSQDELNLCSVIADTVAALQVSGKMKFIEIETNLPEVARIRANRVQMEQILINLLGNAVDAILEMPLQIGRVCITVTKDEERSRILCEIEDQGCGIPADKIDEIFQTYYTTKPPERGTGLGLPIVRQIVKDHGGLLSVQSQPGLGSRFTLDFPEVRSADGEK